MCMMDARQVGRNALRLVFFPLSTLEDDKGGESRSACELVITLNEEQSRMYMTFTQSRASGINILVTCFTSCEVLFCQIANIPSIYLVTMCR
jgi:hypothetical protein